ncbi:MAG: GDSL-type esterase/lipase family protein [Comamonas sp.]|nr:GDSL-type esterase/lipase family protein [Comamonas sp.]
MTTLPASPISPSSSSRRQLLLAVLASSVLSACGRSTPKAQALPSDATVLALGDSLTQGVGAQAQEAWPHVLAQRTGWEVVNGGVSGDTSAQALERLPDLLEEHRPALVVISIGGNDFLRQMSADAAQANIRRMCQLARDSGAQVLLVAVPQASLLAAGTGTLNDHPLYETLAQELQLPLLEGAWAQVLSQPALRSDQVHANAAGYAQFTEQLLDFVRQHGWWT